LADIKDSDLPCIRYFIPVHQTIESYPGDIKNLDFEHVKMWTSFSAVKSDVVANTKNLENEELKPEERE